MAFDTRAFRHALGCFPTGVAVVTAGSDKDRMGITVNSFASVSLDPPLVLWCMDRRSSRYRTFTKAGNFTISILASDHQAISAKLASPGEHCIDDLSLLPTESGPPGLVDSLAVFECAREHVYNTGDHVIIIGRVVNFSWRKAGEPLVFFRGRYGTVPDSG
jgi:4-hydroxyphenylacetate 3-hydroxylase, reductase component